MTSTLKQYIRNEKNHPIGVIMATKNEEGNIIYGWSMCSPRDSFDKKLGEIIARNRMESEKPSAHGFGYKMPKDQLKTFIEKANYVFNRPPKA